MERKVSQNTIQTYGGQWENRVELPVETELLIPDYKPAVFKIVKCLLEPVLLQNDCRSGYWLAEGYMRCTVYYQSDENGCCLHRAEQKFPFEKKITLPEGEYQEGPAQWNGKTEYCNCRAVSSRRIDLRGAYTLQVNIMTLQETVLLENLTGNGVETRRETLDTWQCIMREERMLTAETEVPKEIENSVILEIDGVFAPGEVTVSEGQLTENGTLHIQLCTREATTVQPTVQKLELPVHTTLENKNLKEGDTAVCWGQVQSRTLTAGEDAKPPMLTVEWLLHVEVWRKMTYQIVADTYSTLCETEITWMERRLLQQGAVLEQTAKAVVEDELPGTAGEIIACFVTLGQPGIEKKEDKQPILEGSGMVHLLCCDERGEINCFDKSFLWSLPPQEGSSGEQTVQVHAYVRQVATFKTGDTVRAELEIAVNGIAFQVEKRRLIESVTEGEALEETEEHPAVFLYHAGEKEPIFEIAKRYHAKESDLIAVNKLGADSDREQTDGEKWLLIPSAQHQKGE